jgi:uncharacterized repeat protein (TIGR03803 family)
MAIKTLYATCSALIPVTFLYSGPLAAASPASSPQYTVLYHFNQSTNGEAGPEGIPIAFNGALYGTVISGGSAGKGTVFRLDLDSLTETTLYSFPGGKKEGASPTGPLSRLGAVIYGSTTQGHGTGPGSNGNYTGYGTIWQLNAHGGKIRLLHGFDGSDGSQPYSGVTAVGGALYGATWYGGAGNAGTLFKLDASGALTQLYAFPDSAIGCNPLDAVTIVDNVLYGTTTFCGANEAGTVYALDLGTGKASVLHSFAATPNGSAEPNALVYQDGALYGTTFDDGGGAGTVYKIDVKTRHYSVLHQFTGGADGGTASSGLTPFQGKLYGVTENGGAGDYGTIYSIDPVSGSQTVVYNFVSGSTGDTPFAGLFAHKGALYGSTLNVDAEYPNIRGALFKFVP